MPKTLIGKKQNTTCEVIRLFFCCHHCSSFPSPCFFAPPSGVVGALPPSFVSPDLLSAPAQPPTHNDRPTDRPAQQPQPFRQQSLSLPLPDSAPLLFLSGTCFISSPSRRCCLANRCFTRSALSGLVAELHAHCIRSTKKYKRKGRDYKSLSFFLEFAFRLSEILLCLIKTFLSVIITLELEILLIFL